jgi:putative transcription factor
LSCDVCGEEIRGKHQKVIIEGAIVVACPQCARLGKIYVEPPRLRLPQPVFAVRRPTRSSRPASRETVGDLEVVEDYAARIRKAREKIGLTQEDLATRVKERLSIIQKIESGKMAPDMKLCRELEHSLRIELLAQRVEIPASVPATSTLNATLTLGDIIKVKRKDQKEVV